MGSVCVFKHGVMGCRWVGDCDVRHPMWYQLNSVDIL